MGNAYAEQMYRTSQLSYSQGWYDEALAKLKQAIGLEPENTAYREALHMMLAGTQHYQQTALRKGWRPQMIHASGEDPADTPEDEENSAQRRKKEGCCGDDSGGAYGSDSTYDSGGCDGDSGGGCDGDGGGGD